MTRDSWKTKGSKSARGRAKEESLRILQKNPIKPIDDVLLRELDNIVKSRI